MRRPPHTEEIKPWAKTRVFYSSCTPSGLSFLPQSFPWTLEMRVSVAQQAFPPVGTPEPSVPYRSASELDLAQALKPMLIWRAPHCAAESDRPNRVRVSNEQLPPTHKSLCSKPCRDGSIGMQDHHHDPLYYAVSPSTHLHCWEAGDECFLLPWEGCSHH